MKTKNEVEQIKDEADSIQNFMVDLRFAHSQKNAYLRGATTSFITSSNITQRILYIRCEVTFVEIWSISNSIECCDPMYISYDHSVFSCSGNSFMSKVYSPFFFRAPNQFFYDDLLIFF